MECMIQQIICQNLTVKDTSTTSSKMKIRI